MTTKTEIPHLTPHEFQALVAYAERGDMTGYDCWRATVGMSLPSAYRATTVFRERGYIEQVATAESSTNSIPRKLYRITEQGRTVLNMHTERAEREARAHCHYSQGLAP